MPSHYRGTREEVAALNAYIPLMRAAESLTARAGLRVAAHGLTLSQFGALEALLHLGPLCQRELGEKLLKSGGNITMVVDNLERRGWVRRQRQKDDRRMIAVHLTPAGRRLISRIFPGHVAAIAREMRCLTASEQQDLRRLSRKLGRGAKNGNEKKRSRRKT